MLKQPHAAESAKPSAATPKAPPIRLADTILIDSATSGAVGGMSETWWWDAVRKGHAPAPAFRAHRCTRWRTADVLQFWERVADEGR
jgi:hypothetical protein